MHDKFVMTNNNNLKLLLLGNMGNSQSYSNSNKAENTNNGGDNTNKQSFEEAVRQEAAADVKVKAVVDANVGLKKD